MVLSGYRGWDLRAMPGPHPLFSGLGEDPRLVARFRCAWSRSWRGPVPGLHPATGVCIPVVGAGAEGVGAGTHPVLVARRGRSIAHVALGYYLVKVDEPPVAAPGAGAVGGGGARAALGGGLPYPPYPSGGGGVIGCDA